MPSVLKCIERVAWDGSWQDSSVQFKKGSYVLLRPAFVALHADDFSPDDDELVAELEEGMAPWHRKLSAKLVSMARAEEVEVVEVVDFVEEERVFPAWRLELDHRWRGRLRDFDGWITLLNRATGTEWVAPTTQVPPSKDTVDDDAPGQELHPELEEAEIARESSVEPEEPDEPLPVQDSPTLLPGLYILLRPAFVSPEAKIFAPEDDELVAELDEGQEIEVTEIIDFESEKSEPADGDSDPEDQGDMEAEEDAGTEPAEPGPKGRRKLFDVGLYVLRRPAFVSPRAELFEPDDDELVAELEEGEEIEIVEVVDFRNLGRVRGKLKSPEGWITLRNSATGIKWVAPKAGSSDDSDATIICHDPPPYPKGFYILVRSAYVAYDADNFAPDDDELVAELEEGDEVEIVEVVDFVEEERVRGRLYDPDGWITLLNRATGAEWVTPKVEVDAGSRGESDDDYSYSEDEDGNPRPRRQRMAYDVGEYILLRPAFVARDAKTFDPDDDEVVEELEEGQEVRAVEIVELKEEKRVRARLHQPDGWVTFANTATGVRRVVAKEEWLETRTATRRQRIHFTHGHPGKVAKRLVELTAESWASGDVGDLFAFCARESGEDEEESDSASESERRRPQINQSEDTRQARRVVHRNSGDMIPSFADVGTVHTDGDLLSRSNQGELAPTPKFKQLYPDGRQDT
ncbi:unnamed protein product [Symbiodinium sp. CCMP2456]|nr:unnamed protein product [Symbiodinium sp. CCMP2456]